jgi:hypothetical protein
MKALALCVLMFFVATVYGQDNLLTWQQNSPLKWEDFSGAPVDNSYFDAETFGDVKYSYTFKSLTEFEFDVQATFDRNASWIRKQSQSRSLLKHEQVHFDIAQLYAFKLKEAFTNFVYTSNFKEEICNLAKQMSLEYHNRQAQYDTETNHSTIAQHQKRWEKLVRQELKVYAEQNLARAEEKNGLKTSVGQ